MPVSEKMAACIVQIQDNLALLSKWIEGLDSMLDVDLIEQHLNTLKEILDVVGISGGLTFRKDGEGRRNSINRRNSTSKREDVIRSYARSLSTILHQVSAKVAKMETSLSKEEGEEAMRIEKLLTSVKLYFDTGLPPVHLMLGLGLGLGLGPQPKGSRRKSMTVPTDKQLRLNNMRRKGMMMMDKSKLFSSSFKQRWIILDDKKLHIFKDEQSTTVYKELPLDAITSIYGAKLGKYEFGFHISCLDGTVLNLACVDKSQMAAWMLAIDGVKHNFSFNSCMDPKEKLALLRYHSFENRKGGYIKSNHNNNNNNNNNNNTNNTNNNTNTDANTNTNTNNNETTQNNNTNNNNSNNSSSNNNIHNNNNNNNNNEWAYFKEGALSVTEGEEVNGLDFKWTGDTLHAFKKLPNGESGNSCLTARWNGITLAYYLLPSTLQRIASKQPLFIPTPVVTYSWYEHDREYRPIEGNRVPTFKWTRHFLVEKNAVGKGEWIVEGDIPEPLVMILQLYHSYKNPTSHHYPSLPLLGGEREREREDVNNNNNNNNTSNNINNKTMTRVKSSTFSLPIPIPNNEAIAMFNKFLPDGQDRLTYEAFGALMHSLKPGLSSAEIRLAFELVDVSKDGVVDQMEFTTWFQELKEWGND